MDFLIDGFYKYKIKIVYFIFLFIYKRKRHKRRRKILPWWRAHVGAHPSQRHRASFENLFWKRQLGKVGKIKSSNQIVFSITFGKIFCLMPLEILNVWHSSYHFETLKHLFENRFLCKFLTKTLAGCLFLSDIVRAF